jgi:hypothetical protein
LDVGEDAPANQTDGRGWPAEGEYAANLDFCRRDTGRISAIGGRSERSNKRAHQPPFPRHRLSSVLNLDSTRRHSGPPLSASADYPLQFYFRTVNVEIDDIPIDISSSEDVVKFHF